MDLQVGIGELVYYGQAGYFRQTAVFASDDLPLDALLPQAGARRSGSTGDGSLDVSYFFHNDEISTELGLAMGSLGSFSYAIAVPEPARDGMMLAGAALLCLFFRARKSFPVAAGRQHLFLHG
ncbi:hypothetical protein [Massilia endophytica]|uniref:hypothetical protein n=1 Tax=Massilia endophytica TaxID=2899220 RepID=UPI001E5FE2B3|nr:hypothetical protein [Massilia endophytica]UGQ47757.1 hypothetical protein LSQ66_04585 [Massilia endophytica]